MIKESDVKHWLMHTLLGVITANENRYGFTTTDNKMIALCEGYTEILTNYLVGDVSDNYFTDEIIMTNLISKVVGADVLFEAYFHNDSEKVLTVMTEAGKKVIELMDENFEATKSESRPSEIGFLQSLAGQTFPVLFSEHLDCFFTNIECFPKSEKINEEGLKTAGEIISSAEGLRMARDINSLGQEAIYKS